jgi:hypothetical protein
MRIGMTLGQYPDDVPPKYGVGPETYRSDYDIKRFRDVAPSARRHWHATRYAFNPSTD